MFWKTKEPIDRFAEFRGVNGPGLELTVTFFCPLKQTISDIFQLDLPPSVYFSYIDDSIRRYTGANELNSKVKRLREYGYYDHATSTWYPPHRIYNISWTEKALPYDIAE